MVVPNGAPDAMPTILVDHGGVWRDMSWAGQSGERMSDVIGTINQFLEGLSRLIGTHDLPADHQMMKNTFNQFFEKIVPPKVRELLAETLQAAGANETPVLRIHTQSTNEWIPWEVLEDGSDFLGFRFQIARLPIVSHILPASNNQPHTVRNIASFLGQNVLDAAQRQEWESTFTGLINPPAVENLFPAHGNAVNFPDVDLVSRNYQNADILHVMCHGIKENETVYLTLNHHTAPPASSLFKIDSSALNSFVFRTRPLVFGNGCTSSGAVGGNQTAAGLMPPGIGASFFGHGALNFVGTFAPVSKAMALQFGRKFYEHLLGQNGQLGLPIAEALWATKDHFRQLNSNDPSYLFYCLYGPPEITYQV
jgi:hypothetical protein